ncbi:MAG: hypothetical protein AAFO82_20980 [Bacteroidota bacterium]
METTIALKIDELILHGFSKKDGFYIGRAMEQELSKLIELNGLPDKLSTEQSLTRIEASDFEFEEKAKPENIGKQIANSIYQGFSTAEK